MDDLAVAADIFEITPWRSKALQTGIINVKSFRGLFSLSKVDLVMLLPEYSADKMEKIKPLFGNITRMFDYYAINYCALSLSDLVLECEFGQIKDRASPKAIISFGCGDKFKDEICKTVDLSAVLQDPMLKKQVFSDVRRFCI